MSDENLITWLLMAFGFLGIIWWGGMSMEFQRGCEASCGEDRALTPIMDFQEVCLCDEGHGKWSRKFISAER